MKPFILYEICLHKVLTFFFFSKSSLITIEDVMYGLTPQCRVAVLWRHGDQVWQEKLWRLQMVIELIERTALVRMSLGITDESQNISLSAPQSTLLSDCFDAFLSSRAYQGRPLRCDSHPRHLHKESKIHLCCFCWRLLWVKQVFLFGISYFWYCEGNIEVCLVF